MAIIDETKGNAGPVGEWFFRIEQRTEDDPEAKCKVWSGWQENYLKSAVMALSANITSCPCTAMGSELDTRFQVSIEADILCVESKGLSLPTVETDGTNVTGYVTRRCCYYLQPDDLNGVLIQNGIHGGSLMVEYFSKPDELYDDNTAKHLCCKDSNQCELFYKVRPSDNCTNYNPPSRRKRKNQFRL